MVSFARQNEADELIIMKNGFEVRRSNIEKLTQKPDCLDDQIINVYMAMVTERNNRTEGWPKVCSVDSMVSRMDGRNNRKAWEKIDFQMFDLILIPVHIEKLQHWALVVIDKKQKLCNYFDSNNP